MSHSMSNMRKGKALKIFNNSLAGGLWALGILMLCVKADPFAGGLFFVPFSLWPHAVTHIGMLLARKRRTQIFLLVTMLLYFAWFMTIYMDAFYVHLDPQSPIVLLFVGTLAAPVMLVLWIITLVLELIRKEK